MNTKRLTALMESLLNQTVLGELLAPVTKALARVRGSHAFTRVLSMADFITLGILRHLQGMPTLREQVQSLLHLEPGDALQPPLARSTWSDALSSPRRGRVLRGLAATAVVRGPSGFAGSIGGIRRAGRTPGVRDGWHLPHRKCPLGALYAQPRG